MNFLTRILDKIKSLLGLRDSLVDEFRVRMISVDKIIANPYQPRSSVDEEALEELADSIEEYGVVTPIIVTPVKSSWSFSRRLSADGVEGGRFQLVAGERRVRAARKNGMKKIPALVREYSDEELVEVSFMENLQREPMSEVDIAEMYKRLREEFKNISVEELGEVVGKSPEEITRRDWILELPLITRKALSEGVLDRRQARLLTQVDGEENHRKIISFVANEKPDDAEFVARLKEYEPDLDTTEFEETELTEEGVQAPFVPQLVKEFHQKLQQATGEAGDGEGSEAEPVEQEIPPEFHER